MVEVVERTKRCREIVRELQLFEYISLDSEGINLGKDGPLTLLQIGTVDGDAYLFDVFKNPKLFDKGKLQNILQSKDIVKVIHSCRCDSAALYYQFDITLENVFDTQVAHLVLEEHKGKKFPRKINGVEICEKYSEETEVPKEKKTMKEIFGHIDGNFWARRPLKEKMITYAAGDVISPIPEVYEEQTRGILLYLHNQSKSWIWVTWKKLANGQIMKHDRNLDKFEERVYEEVHYALDKKISAKYHKRQKKMVKSIYEKIPDKYPPDTAFDDITDEDDIAAIRKIKIGQGNLDPMLKRLQTESITRQLNELDEQISSKNERFIPKARSYSFLRSYAYHSDDEIKEDSERILENINTSILDNMCQKYERDTRHYMLALNEKEALNTLRPKTVRDRNINPFLLDMYWSTKAENLDSTIQTFIEKGDEYSIPKSFYRWLKFCCNGKVPDSMKSKARRLMKNLDRTFGKGVVPGSHPCSD